MKIICMGGCNIDWIAVVPGNSFPAQNIYTQFFRSFGGVSHNIAQNLKSMGHYVSIVSALGQDEDANQLIEEMKHSGIRTDMIIRVQGKPTGKIVIVNNEQGKQIFHHCQTDVYQALTPQIIRQFLPLLSSFDAWVVDTDIEPATLEAIAAYKPNNIPLYVVVAAKEKTLRVRPILAHIDYLFINRYEAQLLTNIVPDSLGACASQAHSLQALGVKNLFLTMGEHGVYSLYANQLQHYLARPEINRHTTGAGDGFASSVIDGTLTDYPLDAIMENGLEFASLIINSEDSTYVKHLL